MIMMIIMIMMIMMIMMIVIIMNKKRIVFLDSQKNIDKNQDI